MTSQQTPQDNNPLYKNPVTHHQNPLSPRSPSFVYKQPDLPPLPDYPSPTSSDTEFSRTSSATNNQLPRRYNTGDFQNRDSPVKDAVPVEEKVINTAPPLTETPPDDISQSIDIASNMGEFDDILGDIQSTLSRDTVLSNPSATGRAAPYPPPRRTADLSPSRNSMPPPVGPPLPPRSASPASAPDLPPRDYRTLPIRRRESREGTEGYVESDL